jgi:hypothetical protein
MLDVAQVCGEGSGMMKQQLYKFSQNINLPKGASGTATTFKFEHVTRIGYIRHVTVNSVVFLRAFLSDHHIHNIVDARCTPSTKHLALEAGGTTHAHWHWHEKV